MDNQFDTTDGGMSSRKLWLTILVAFMIFAGNLLSARWAAVATSYTTMVGGLIAALSVYAGANVSNRWLTSKHVLGMSNTLPVEPMPPDAESETKDQ